MLLNIARVALYGFGALVGLFLVLPFLVIVLIACFKVSVVIGVGVLLGYIAGAAYFYVWWTTETMRR